MRRHVGQAAGATNPGAAATAVPPDACTGPLW
jgi:hypothetical protein